MKRINKMTINKRAIEVLQAKFDFEMEQVKAAINVRYEESITYWVNKAIVTATEIHELETQNDL
tara:strand:- start:262 stop:453 length:192 start_codon:yes stop_codon:yes gene_type:complete